MAQVTRTYGSATIKTGATVIPEHINTDLDTIYTDYNGGITNYNIASNADIAISKTTLGTYTAWTDYTPTIYKNDGITAWSHTLGESRYTQIGKTIIWSLMFVPESLTNTGSYTYITLPVAAKSNATYNRNAGSAWLQWSGNSTVGWPLGAYLSAAGTRIYIGWSSAYNNGTTWNDTIANPYVYCKFTYEAA